jgi:hypothetical protein
MDGDFGNIIGFLIFAAIAVLSIFSKIREQRKTGEEVQEQEHEEETPSLDELPELVRRMIRGGVEAEPEHPEPERHKTAEKTSPTPIQTLRPVVEELRRNWTTEKAPVTPPVPPEGWEGPYEAPVQPPRQSKRIRRQQQEAEKVKAVSPPVSKPTAPPKKAMKAPRTTAAVRLANLFADKNLVRNGILYQEILGPPKALRDRPE